MQPPVHFGIDMPFTSKAQQRFMFAKHPKLAKEFAAKTENIGELPEHVLHPGVKPGKSKKRRS